MSAWLQRRSCHLVKIQCSFVHTYVNWLITMASILSDQAQNVIILCCYYGNAPFKSRDCITLVLTVFNYLQQSTHTVDSILSNGNLRPSWEWLSHVCQPEWKEGLVNLWGSNSVQPKSGVTNWIHCLPWHYVQGYIRHPTVCRLSLRCCSS